MTLLVVGIGIPRLHDGALDQALGDKRQEIFSFFLSFVVIGFYWLGHHSFFATLQRVDRRFMELNLLYLAAIAFMPFPTALVGSYGDAEIAVVLYAVTLASASLLETILLWRAREAVHASHVSPTTCSVGPCAPLARRRSSRPSRSRTWHLPVGPVHVDPDLPARDHDRPHPQTSGQTYPDPFLRQPTAIVTGE
jgi:hypothetical protein